MKDRTDGGTNPPARPKARGEVFSRLAMIPGIQVIYASALACTRHRGNELAALQRQGILSYLLFDEIDMITGDYINKIKLAAEEIAQERAPSGIILMTGCQSALLSTDHELLARETEQKIGVPVRTHDGCRLCGFDEDSADSGSGQLERLLYDFIQKREMSQTPCVNIIGGARTDGDSELYAVLEKLGVKKILRLSGCKSREDYQEMGGAHMNIITSAQAMPVGPYLQEKLGIPFVCLGGIYDPRELEAAYEKLGQAFGTEADVSELKKQAEDKLVQVKGSIGARKLTVENDGYLVKWLLSEGFDVESLVLRPHHGITAELREWFAQNAPALKIESGGMGHGGAGGMGRGEEHGGMSRGGAGGMGRGERGGMGHGGAGGMGHGERGGMSRGGAGGMGRGEEHGGMGHGERGGMGHGERGGMGHGGAGGMERRCIGFAGSIEALDSLEAKAEGEE